MATVIMTFHNEEYYLPWWIRHHAKLFENGILIDYDSTDHSWEICKWLCPPNWKIVKSRNRDFDASKLDREIQYYEQTVSGFKMSLTTAEFLITPVALEKINDFCLIFNKETPCYFTTVGVAMVDSEPTVMPTYYQNLVEQKHHGMISGYKAAPNTATFDNGEPIDDFFKSYYSRLYHNAPYGDYVLGRHWTLDHSWWNHRATDVFTLKYKYSPWNDTILKRLQQFKHRVPQSDLDRGFCTFHTQAEETYIKEYEHYLKTAHDLKEDDKFLKAYEYTMGL